MTWPQHRVEAYERMVSSIRRLMHDEADTIPAHVLAEMDRIINAAQDTPGADIKPGDSAGAGSRELAASRFPAGGQPPAKPDPALTDSQILARWLWDRNLDISATNGLAPERCERFTQAAGIATPARIEVWTEATALVTAMELLADKEPDSPLLERQNLAEHSHWLDAMPAGDPFSHSSKAVANRMSKAKTLARWLWDRDIDGQTMLGFTDKFRRAIARNAGVNPPSSLTTWQLAAVLIAQMEVRLAADPANPAVVRHHVEERGRWASGHTD